MADEKKAPAADEKKAPQVELSYPPPAKSLKGTEMEGVLNEWSRLMNRRRRAGQYRMQGCRDPKCYYPLVARRDASTGHQDKWEETEKGKALHATCSWDPRHCDGKQFIYPDEETDE